MFSFFFFEPTYSIPLHKLVSLPSYFRKQVSYFLFRYFLTFLLLSALYHCSFTEVWNYIQVATSTEKNRIARKFDYMMLLYESRLQETRY